MTDWSRLTDYIYNYFPDPSYSRAEVIQWAQENVPAWKYMNNDDRKMIIGDWEAFVSPVEPKQIEAIREDIEEIEKDISPEQRGRWGKVKRWLGRLFGRY
ncbi:MAG: hypothetical protein WBH31_11675 [Promethearchaeia archaeon]